MILLTGILNIRDAYEIQSPPPPHHFQGEGSGYK